MPLTRRAPALLVSSLMAFGCGPRRPPEDAHTAAAKLPTVKVQSEDEYATVRADYDALPIGDPRRDAARRGLSGWALGEAERYLKANRPESAYEALTQRTLPLWDAEELKSPPDDAELRRVAEDLERAFRRRGAHAEVVATLAVQITLAPSDPAPRERYRQVVAWLRSDPSAVDDAHPRCTAHTCGRVLDDLEATVAVWPSPFAVDELARLYEERQRWQRPEWRNLQGDLADMLSEKGATRIAYDLARLYLRLSRPADAVAALKKLGGQLGDDPKLRESLERYVAPDGKPADAIAIAGVFFREPADRPVAQRVCEDASRRFPLAVEPLMCVGDVAEQRDLVSRAIVAFDAALKLQPDRREVWEALARLHQKRLFQLVSDEKTDELEAELQRVEKVHADAAKRYPNQPLHISVAGALFEVGRGYYNAGRVDEAVRSYERSLALEPTVPVLEELGVVALKRGDAQKALGLFDRALSLASAADRKEFLYWRAKLGRGEGDAHELAGAAAEAEKARRQAVQDFELLDRMISHGNLNSEEAVELAEVDIERGKVLYEVGDRVAATASFERAIDAAPDRGATYAEVLAFLVPRGEREEALDAYHRALGRQEVSEYLKVYCTLWITDLDRRAGEPEDPLARAFLESIEGGKWYHELARWASGRATDAELVAHAESNANRAEAWFYQAMRRAQGGRLDEARALWKRVLDTQMMAFFEYDMASYYLHHGVAAKPAPVVTLPRKNAAPTVTPVHVPDGSI